jgi:hypothetical protein
MLMYVYRYILNSHIIMTCNYATYVILDFLILNFFNFKNIFFNKISFELLISM